MTISLVVTSRFEPLSVQSLCRLSHLWNGHLNREEPSLYLSVSTRPVIGQFCRPCSTLSYGRVSKGLGTNEFDWLKSILKRSRFSHLDRSCCNSCSKKVSNKEYEKIGLFLFIILNGRINRPLRGRRKRKRWLIWVLPKKLRAKMKSKLRNFSRSRNQKTFFVPLLSCLAK